MFDYVASFGAFADTAYSTPQRLKNALGRAAYFLCGIKQVFELKQHHIVLEADGKRIEGDFYYGSVSNSTRIAGIIDLKHAGVAFDDGRLEVLLIRQPPTVKALKDFQRGKYDPEYFYFFSAGQVSIDFDEPAEWTADGEEFTDVRTLPADFRFFNYQRTVNARTAQVPSHAVIEDYLAEYGRDYRYEDAPHPVKALQDREKDNTRVGRTRSCTK